MAMYQEIYKCRLCGETFRTRKLYKKSRVEKKMGRLSVIFPYIINERGIELHNCHDGSCGLADFQGFKEAED